MNILLTGAQGKIGQALYAYLCNKTEYKIIKHQKNNYDFSKIHTIIHTAGTTHSHNKRKYFANNLDLTKKIVSAAEKYDVEKIIFLSSCASSKQGGAYANSKLLAEQKIKTFSRSFVILRLAEVWGEKNFEGIGKIIAQIKKHYLVFLPPRVSLYAPIHVDDILPAITKALDPSIKNQNFILAGDEIMATPELARRIKGELNKKSLLLYVPIFALHIAAILCRLLNLPIIYQDQIPRLLTNKDYNNSKAKETLNFAPRKFMKSKPK